jgi:hypothetical protein
VTVGRVPSTVPGMYDASWADSAVSWLWTAFARALPASGATTALCALTP